MLHCYHEYLLAWFQALHLSGPFCMVTLLPLELRNLPCQGRETAAEKRYRKLLLSGLELNKDFYFSYTYNLARTLQTNLTAEAPADPFDSMFVWNEYLSRC